MSRFSLTAAVTATVQGFPSGHMRLKAGSKIADTIGNAVAGDWVCPTLANPTSVGAAANLIPLDVAAQTLLSGLGISRSVGGFVRAATGVESIE
jgi:hypothetical protein